jgi:glycosyltransferase involved in cell wall biosynthesis
MIRIGFIADADIHDRTAWSGTISNFADILSQHYIIVPIVIKHNIIEKVCKGFQYILSGGKVKKGGILRFYNKKRLHSKLKEKQCDILFAPAQSELISCGIPSDKKLIYLSDAVYKLMLGYYWFNISDEEQKYGDECEQKALDRANQVIFSSEWAKDGAIYLYNCSAKKIHVIPFGANLEDYYIPKNEVESQQKSPINILLVGVDWKRKGIDLAIQCVQYLHSMQNKYNFNLTIVGFEKPKNQDFPPYIYFAGRLNKNNREEYDKLIQIYQHSDLFLLPTKAECSAIVFSEASEYALPVITHNTGGVPTYVEDNITGRCLPLGSTGKDFANAIYKLVDSGALSVFSKRARKKYESMLNWNSWLEEFDKIVDQIIK